MDELIRKQTVLNMIDYLQFGNFGTATERLTKLYDAVEIQPSVDAVEVVRCENCTYAETATGWLGGYLWCVKDFETGCGQKMAKQKDDFCSFGERKTDG